MHGSRMEGDVKSGFTSLGMCLKERKLVSNSLCNCLEAVDWRIEMKVDHIALG